MGGQTFYVANHADAVARGGDGICVRDSFIEDMFFWASIFKDQAEYFIAKRSRAPLFSIAGHVMRPSAKWGQV